MLSATNTASRLRSPRLHWDLLMASVKENFARNLSELLKKHRKELAEALHVAPSTVTGWTKGKFTPAVERLDEIADFFGVSYVDLITGEASSTSRRDIDAIVRELRAAIRDLRISKM
jgi:transcriptional regulator with XRE-family HTH domain